MSPGRDALLEPEALCGIPADFSSMPLASESTEADENSPDPHRNSVSPGVFLPVKASMALPSREEPVEAHFSSGKYQERSWSGSKERHANPCQLSSNGIQADVRHTSPSPACGLPGSTTEHRLTTQSVHSSVSSEHTSDSISKLSTPQIFLDDSDGSGSDDGVAVYIDETDDDANDGLLITECRISSRKAAEIRAFKERWVEQMLLKKAQLLSPSLTKGVGTGGKRRTCSASKETNGHESGAAATQGDGAEFLESKLRAFAACMMPEALECICRNAKRWVEASSDSSDSESPGVPSCCSRRRHSKAVSGALPLSDRSCHDSAAPHARTPATEKQQQPAYSRDQQQGDAAADIALQSWGRFLKYIRKTSRILPSRQRIEWKAGLESDDDDEQAPLYMCRPGSVQRPSPLISHSLTEHLKASGTMFFKQFRRQYLAASVPATPDTSGVTSTQPQLSTAVGTESASDCAVVHASPASDSAGETVNDDERKSHSKADAEEAVPLYEISAETSALFGDMMRLEDTARMLDASCTFRLPAAPSSIVRSKKSKPKTGVEPAHRHSGSSVLCCGGAGLCSAAIADSTATAATATAATAPPQHRRRGHVTLYTSPHAATAAALSQLIVNCQAEKRLEAHAHQHVPCVAVAGASLLKPEETSFDREDQEGNGSCVVYTVQADEDTLALSGLDAEYCARVRSASQGRNRAASSLAHLECMQLNGSALQGSVTPEAVHKKKRKAPVETTVVSSDDEESGSERSPGEEEAPGTACRAEAAEEASSRRSLMVDKLMLAHLMPYLPQFGPP
ncbi:uncharacterized protein EMH_0015710 [Eimeria mitis]|uniref:Uncharacterized protein n=1 Tax=Eimeria mitis TaxID=44415 RepID=U6K5Y7_9EIME|nr:uncharacterized protein EMH_0015710 [Eimeria mitis]CDJ33344.1 hypothetical protein, conserved [Eimeria mitis]